GLFALDEVEKLLAGEDAAGVPRQRRQHLVLVGGQALPDAVDTHFTGGEIDLQTSGGELDRVRVGGRAAQHRPDPGEQLARVERLREVIVGAELETDDLVRVVAAGGHHDDRRLPAL